MEFKVYYLDDELELLDIFESTFSTSNIHIKTFSNPNLALEAIAKEPPHLIFLDYRLAGLNGDDFANKIDRKIPKVLLAANIDRELGYSFDAKIEKPYEQEDIRKIIMSYADLAENK